MRIQVNFDPDRKHEIQRLRRILDLIEAEGRGGRPPCSKRDTPPGTWNYIGQNVSQLYTADGINILYIAIAYKPPGYTLDYMRANFNDAVQKSSQPSNIQCTQADQEFHVDKDDASFLFGYYAVNGNDYDSGFCMVFPGLKGSNGSCCGCQVHDSAGSSGNYAVGQAFDQKWTYGTKVKIHFRPDNAGGLYFTFSQPSP